MWLLPILFFISSKTNSFITPFFTKVNINIKFFKIIHLKSQKRLLHRHDFPHFLPDPIHLHHFFQFTLLFSVQIRHNIRVLPNPYLELIILAQRNPGMLKLWHAACDWSLIAGKCLFVHGFFLRVLSSFNYNSSHFGINLFLWFLFNLVFLKLLF